MLPGKRFIPVLACSDMHLSPVASERRLPGFIVLLGDHKRLLRKIKKFYSRARMYLTLSSFYLIDSLQVTASLSALEKHFAAIGLPLIFLMFLEIAVEGRSSVNVFRCLFVITCIGRLCLRKTSTDLVSYFLSHILFLHNLESKMLKK